MRGAGDLPGADPGGVRLLGRGEAECGQVALGLGHEDGNTKVGPDPLPRSRRAGRGDRTVERSAGAPSTVDEQAVERLRLRLDRAGERGQEEG